MSGNRLDQTCLHHEKREGSRVTKFEASIGRSGTMDLLLTGCRQTIHETAGE